MVTGCCSTHFSVPGDNMVEKVKSGSSDGDMCGSDICVEACILVQNYSVFDGLWCHTDHWSVVGSWIPVAFVQPCGTC